MARLLASDNGIKKAINYNYDPLVQECLLDVFGVCKDDILTHPGKWNKEDAVNSDTREIFHIHGFIKGERHNDTSGRVYPDTSDDIILSENSYYKMEQTEVYDWANSVHSYFLNKYSCLFIGFSAEDYNFRRILRQLGTTNFTSPKRPQHYMVMTINDLIEKTYKDVCRYYYNKRIDVSVDLTNDIKEASLLLIREILAFKEKYWKNYGITPIWTTIKEIPENLADLI